MRKLALLLLAALGAATTVPAATAPDVRPFVPVFTTNFPDPFILPNGGEFLAYATNAEGGQANVQMARSTNLVDWQFVRDGTRLHDAMPDLPPWAKESWTWAPEVMRTDTGYLLYFTAKDRRTELQCTGVAHSSDPRGPFVSTATEPLVCQPEIGGTIDASPFRDADGQLYLYFKNDGNHPRFGKPTDIFVQRLTADGLSLTGERRALLRNDTGWEAHVIESPTMVRHASGYTMLFSANHFGWETHQRLSPYAMGYARCEGPMGPCTDSPDNPILHSYHNREAGCLSGPGHQAVFDAAGRQFIVFHAHIAKSGCRRPDEGGRQMYVAPISWRDGVPVIAISLRPGERG